jgi:hypothetical protein
MAQEVSVIVSDDDRVRLEAIVKELPSSLPGEPLASGSRHR